MASTSPLVTTKVNFPKQITTMFQTITTAPSLVNAQFTTPKNSQSAKTLRAAYSQRDLAINTSRSFLKPFAQSVDKGSYFATQPLIEASSSTILSPSGKYTLSIKVHTPSNPNPSTQKQTILEVYDNGTMEIVSSSFLDGTVLTTTPFSAPEWSDDEQVIVFSFLHTKGVNQLQVLLKQYHEAEKTPEDAKKEAPQPEFKFSVEQALSDILTDDRYSTFHDLGEQLNGIDYPILSALHVPSGSVSAVHTPTMSTVLMPTLFKIGSPHTTNPHQATITSYPLYFVAQPIFPFRGGTIFYSSRPSRLYLTTFQVESSPSQPPTLLLPPQFPVIYCLTPDAHTIHGLTIHTQPSGAIDVNFVEADFAYDERWGLNHHLIGRLDGLLESIEPSQPSNITMYLEKTKHSPAFAELLSPHGTALALRLLRLSKTQYGNIMNLLSYLTYYSTHPEVAANIPYFSGLLPQLTALYTSSLPIWPYYMGASQFGWILNHTNLTANAHLNQNNVVCSYFIQNVQNIDEITTFHKFFHTTEIPLFVFNSQYALSQQTKSLLPVQSFSYGVYIGGNFTIHRLSDSTIAYSTALRETSVLCVVQYAQLDQNQCQNDFIVKYNIICPPHIDPLIFQQSQFNNFNALNTPQTEPNHPKLPPLIAEVAFSRLLHVPENTQIPAPLLPVGTQFTKFREDGTSVFVRDDVTDILPQDIALHTTIPTLDVCDTRGGSVLALSSITTTPPRLYKFDLPADLLNFSAAQQDEPLVFKAISEVYDQSLFFHTTPRAIINAKTPGQTYTPHIHPFPEKSPISICHQSLPRKLIDSLSHINTISVDIRGYNEFSQNQLIISYDTTLYNEQLNSELIGAENMAKITKTTPVPQTLISNNFLPTHKRGIIFNVHGGPHSNSSCVYDFVTTTMVLAGYIVCKIQYGGSSGMGEQSNRALCGYIGSMDATDCLYGVDVATALFKIKSNNPLTSKKTPNIANFEKLPIIWYGGSHSGFLGSWVTVQRHWTACIIRNAVLSLTTTGLTSDIYDWVSTCVGLIPQHIETYPDSGAFIPVSETDICPNDDIKQAYSIVPWSISRAFSSLSPMNFTQFIKTPTFIHLGKNDQRVPHLQSKTYHKLLLQHRVPTVLNQYPNAQHSLSDTPHIHSHSTCSALSFMEHYANLE